MQPRLMMKLSCCCISLVNFRPSSPTSSRCPAGLLGFQQKETNRFYRLTICLRIFSVFLGFFLVALSYGDTGVPGGFGLIFGELLWVVGWCSSVESSAQLLDEFCFSC